MHTLSGHEVWFSCYASSDLLLVYPGVRQTLTDTKSTFLEMADTIVPTMVNNPLQELLAQHHLIRFNSKYEYDVVFALGIKTVLNQVSLIIVHRA